MKIRDILNKIVWDSQFSRQKERFFIQYTHRGVSGDNLMIPCSYLEKVLSDSFEYRTISLNEPVRIPFHRIEKILNYQTNEILYEKRLPGVSSGK